MSLQDEIEVDYTLHLLALRDPSPVESDLDASNDTMFVKDPNADGIQSEADGRSSIFRRFAEALILSKEGKS